VSSVGSKGLNDKTCEVLVQIHKQSPDIAGVVQVGFPCRGAARRRLAVLRSLA
jgi:S-adenosylmethionine synthetase